MTDPQAPSLLDQLDQQQDEVLAALDELNDQIVQLLEQHGEGNKGREADTKPPIDDE